MFWRIELRSECHRDVRVSRYVEASSAREAVEQTGLHHLRYAYLPRFIHQISEKEFIEKTPPTEIVPSEPELKGSGFVMVKQWEMKHD